MAEWRHMSRILPLLLALALVLPVSAQQYFSIDGRYRFTVNAGQTFQGTLEKMDGDKATEVWSAPLKNTAPQQVLVSYRGRWVVVLDQASVSIYNDSGKGVRTLPRQEVFADSQIQDAWIDPADGELILLSRAGKVAAVDLQSGKTRVAGVQELRNGLTRLPDFPPLGALDRAIVEGWENLPRSELPDGKMEHQRRMRWAVILALKEDQRARDLVLRAARGEEQLHPLALGDALAYLPLLLGKEARPYLLKALEQEPESLLTPGAIEGFKRLGDQVLPDLYQALNNPQSPKARVWAARTLAEMQDKKALPALLQAAADPQPRVAQSAVEAAWKLGGKQVAPEFVKLLDQGTSADGTLVKYFEQVRHRPAVPVLVKALAERGLSTGQALGYQTGAQLGDHPERWRSWLATGDRASLQLAHGDPSGFLEEVRDGGLTDDEIRAKLQAMPRLVNVLKVSGNIFDIRGDTLIDQKLRRYRLPDWDSGPSPVDIGGKSRVIGPAAEKAIVFQQSEPVQVFDLRTGELLQSNDPKSTVVDALWCGNRVLTLDGNGQAVLWTRDGIPLKKFVHPGAVAFLLSEDASTLATGGAELKLWSVESSEMLWEGRPRGFPSGENLRPLAWSKDGKLLAFGTSSMVGWVGAGDGQLLHSLAGGFGDFSPDGQLAAVFDGSQCQLYTVSGKAVGGPLSFPGRVRRAQFAPNGRWYVAGDGQQLRFATPSGRQFCCMSTDGTRATGGYFGISADTRFFCHAEENGWVRVWAMGSRARATDLKTCQKWVGWSLEHGRPLTADEFLR